MSNQTKIDDILIQMISPKLKEIEGRFSSGEGLSTEDINTLLLKSQFNHINHLDEKLNEVTADVASLKLEFAGLKGEFNSLKSEFKLLETSLNARMSLMEETLQRKMQEAINKNMQWSIGLIAFIVTALKVIDMIWKK